MKTVKTHLGYSAEYKPEDQLYDEYVIHGCTLEFAKILDYYVKFFEEKYKWWKATDDYRVSVILYMSTKIPHYQDTKGRLWDKVSLKTYFSIIVKSKIIQDIYRIKKERKDEK